MKEKKTIKVRACSDFHFGVGENFVLPCAEGTYVRKVKKSCGADCNCGYPVAHTTWVIDDGWKIDREYTQFGDLLLTIYKV